jgi:hypothetical protein
MLVFPVNHLDTAQHGSGPPVLSPRLRGGMGAAALRATHQGWFAATRHFGANRLRRRGGHRGGGGAESSTRYETPPRVRNTMGRQAEAAVIPSPPPSGPGPEDGSSRSPSPPLPSPPSHRVSLSLMVVPTNEPTVRIAPLKRSLFFRFKSSRSEGVSKRQPHEIRGFPPRQPIVNDLHIASLYSDKVLTERQLRDLRVEHRDLHEPSAVVWSLSGVRCAHC